MHDEYRNLINCKSEKQDQTAPRSFIPVYDQACHAISLYNDAETLDHKSNHTIYFNQSSAAQLQDTNTQTAPQSGTAHQTLRLPDSRSSQYDNQSSAQGAESKLQSWPARLHQNRQGLCASHGSRSLFGLFRGRLIDTFTVFCTAPLSGRSIVYVGRETRLFSLRSLSAIIWSTASSSVNSNCIFTYLISAASSGNRTDRSGTILSVVDAPLISENGLADFPIAKIASSDGDISRKTLLGRDVKVAQIAMRHSPIIPYETLGIQLRRVTYSLFHVSLLGACCPPDAPPDTSKTEAYWGKRKIADTTSFFSRVETWTSREKLAPRRSTSP
eukprot:IDg7763t1